MKPSTAGARLFAALAFVMLTALVGDAASEVGPMPQTMQRSIFWQEGAADSMTAVLCHLNKLPFVADHGAQALAFAGEPRLVEDGRFGGAAQLAPGDTVTLRLPASASKGAVESSTVDFWLRLQAWPQQPMALLNMGAASLQLSPEGKVSLRVNGEEVATSASVIEPGTWHHLSLMLSFRYNDFAKTRITVDGTPVIDRSFDPALVGAVWKAIRGTTVTIGSPFPDSPVLDVDEIRASAGERLFYEQEIPALTPSATPPRILEGQRLNSRSGAVSFWFRPENWDVRAPLYWGRKWLSAWGARQLPLFSVGTGGESFKPAWEVFVVRELQQNQPDQLQLHPGKWYLVTVTWMDGAFSVYVNDRKLEKAAPIAVKVIGKPAEEWTADTLMFTFARPRHANRPASLDEVLSLGENAANDRPSEETCRSDIREVQVHDRFRSPTEIANAANRPFPDRKQVKLGPVDVICHLNGVKGTADVTVYKLDASTRKVKLEMGEQASGNELATEILDLTSQAVASCTMLTGPLDFKPYALRCTAIDGDGKAGASSSQVFNRVKPPWHDFKGGIADDVLPGWDPVTVDGNSVSVWGRSVEFGDSGLPLRVVSQGEDILAGPVELAIHSGGKELQLTAGATGLKLIKATESEVLIEGYTEADADFTVRTTVRIEFDGLMWFETALIPKEGAKLEIDALGIVVPYKSENAELVHWWSGEFQFGRGTMRHPKVIYTGKLYEGRGVVFRSNDDERILHPESLRGNFIPYVMLTGMDRGMSWFARNDQGWTIGQHPAVEIERTDGSVNLRLNIINETVVLDAARGFTFGLQPIPLKKLEPNWRMNCGQNVMPDFQAGNCLKSKNAQPEHFNLLPDDMDWAAVNRRYRNGQDGVNRMLTLQERETEKFRELYHRDPNRIEVRQPGIYFNLQWTGNMPEMAREWAEELGYGTEQTGGDFDWWHYSPWFQDFAAWSWDQWLRNTPIEACYFDDTWASPQKQLGGPDAPAYALPDGHVQPGYQFLEYRERFKRMRRLSYENGKSPVMCIHMTHTYFTPYCSLFDIILEGEDRYPNPDRPFEETRDFLDKWPLDRLRFHHAGKWGLISAWLRWGERYGWRREAQWYAHQENAYTAAMALHDLEWRFPAEYLATSGFREPDTEFIPYWGEDNPYQTASQSTKLAIWKRNGKCLVLAVNTGDAAGEATVTFDLGALGLDAAASITDIRPEMASRVPPAVMPETNAEPRLAGDPPEQEPTFSWQGGQLKCVIRKHEYRLFELGNRK